MRVPEPRFRVTRAFDLVQNRLVGRRIACATSRPMVAGGPLTPVTLMVGFIERLMPALPAPPGRGLSAEVVFFKLESRVLLLDFKDYSSIRGQARFSIILNGEDNMRDAR